MILIKMIKKQKLMKRLLDVGFRLPIEFLGCMDADKLTAFNDANLPNVTLETVDSMWFQTNELEPLLVNESFIDEDTEMSDEYTIMLREKDKNNLPIYDENILLTSSVELKGYRSFYQKIREDKSFTIRRVLNRDFLSRSFWGIERQILKDYFKNFGFVPTEFAFAGDKVQPRRGHGYLFYAQPTYDCPKIYRRKTILLTKGEKSVIDL